MADNSFNSSAGKAKFVLCLLFYAYGLKVFISGFSPTRVSKLKAFSTSSLFITCMEVLKSLELCQKMEFNSSYVRHYDKFVLIIIDALRADFIPSVLPNKEFNISLPFIETLIKNKSALPFINKVHSPTVTMPRIKTLTTGSISSFIDVFTNLKATQLNEDSFLTQAKINNFNMVFYGDDTWLKLFPDHFIRSEGTHSFFVSDFQEVDNNVTRHLPFELYKKNWHIMILHYLGVDHIGHSQGPYSSHLPPKLKEMDEIVENIYNNLTGESQSKSLMVICGDHGMTAGGSHGGVSKSELLTPLIFINTNKFKFIPNSKIQTVSQVDFAVTISVLLGTPIPANSFGNIISSVLHFSGLTYKQILNAAFYNLLQLYEVHKIVLPNEQFLHIDQIRSIISKHSDLLVGTNRESEILLEDFSYVLQLYMSLLNDLKKGLVISASGYDAFLIITGLNYVWVSFLLALSCYITTMQNSDCTFFLGSFNITGFSNKINGFLILIFVPLYLISSYKLNALIMIPMHVFMLCLFIWMVKFIVENLKLTFMEKMCISLFVLHAVSLFSSSYIEEEHQVWYFFVTTICILNFFKCVILVKNYCLKNNSVKYQRQSEHLSDAMCLDENVSKACLILFILISHRILRNWNQTGDKWQHLPDISDWLNKQNNIFLKNVLIIFSQIALLFYLKRKQQSFTFYASVVGTLLIFIFKCESEQVCLFFKHNNIDLIIFPWLVYTVIIILILRSIKLSLSRTMNTDYKIFMDFITAWIFLGQLIGRAHNIPLLVAILFQEHYLGKVLWKNNCEIRLNVIFYLFAAITSFFYLGNSNSLSTIDVFSGYTGLLTYKPLIAGFLITCNTYSTVVLWLLLLVYRMLYFTNFVQNSSSNVKIFSSFQVIVLYKLFILSVTCIVMNMMKHHLFVLTVFAPKLFYETCHVIFFIVFTFLICAGSTIQNYKKL